MQVKYVRADILFVSQIYVSYEIKFKTDSFYYYYFVCVCVSVCIRLVHLRFVENAIVHSLLDLYSLNPDKTDVLSYFFLTKKEELDIRGVITRGSCYINISFRLHHISGI